MARVRLRHDKGIWTLAEVEELCRACGHQGKAPPPHKGTWTQQEVAGLLKGFGHRVFSGDTTALNFTVLEAAEPRRKRKEEVS